MTTARWLVVASLATLAAGCNSAERGTDNPNVVLISIDSLRADHIGAYGYAKPTTPAIDRIAAAGVVFGRAYSSTSWTLPAHVALLTGLTDGAHAVVTPTDRLSQAATTLAETLRDAGYATVGFYSGPFLHPQFGLDQGFERYIDCSSYGLGPRVGRATKLHAASHRDVTNPNVLAAVLAELERRDSRPLFYFIHMWDVHYDLIPPPPFDEMFDAGYDGSFAGHDFRHEKGFRKGMDPADYAHVLALYDGEIRSTDETIGRIIAELDKIGLLGDTLIVVTSDHGEEFLEHEGKGHRQTLFEEVTRIPLIVWMPEKLAPRRVADPVSIIDVAPTILDLAGLTPLPNAMGRSLVALALGDRSAEPRAVLSELVAPPKAPDLKALVLGSEKLVVDRKRGSATYYDLVTDPDERHPITADTEPRAHRLAAELVRVTAAARLHALEPDRAGATTGAVMPEALSDRLRSLGYLE